jgi:hypothetical protein
MADTLKVLGQLDPGATTLTDLYTVPASTSAMLSHLVVCNRSATPTTYRISVAVAGAADATKQYLFYDVPIGGNTSHTWHLGISLATTDKVRVYATLATLSFNLFGVEVT